MDKNSVIMKGNEALAEAAIRAGCRLFSGYPITPQTEVLEYGVVGGVLGVVGLEAGDDGGHHGRDGGGGAVPDDAVG